ncbi:MAG TPA: alpha/beta hydrolase [Solirubrobacteraceae bacterium]|nr:alpha/beta hydrolase [Solirubrobacteraceae bacterium]
MIGASERLSDPFEDRFDVDVAGGTLHVARAGPPPERAESVVLAVHGVTASLMTWRTVARELPARARATLLAPDLRGRGRSATLPGPYGIATHVTDLLAVLDHVGARRAVLVGHSLGAYVVARLAAEHPERAAGLVLLDAGLPLPPPDDPEDVMRTAVGQTVMRLGITFPSVHAYVEAWRSHPAFAHAWNEDIEQYARYDLVKNGNAVRCVASRDAVRTDSAEMVLDDVTRTALDRVPAQDRVHLLRAERGLFDDRDDPLISADELRAFAAGHPAAHVDAVAGVNHYTLVMGDSPGPHKVAAAIQDACSR